MQTVSATEEPEYLVMKKVRHIVLIANSTENIVFYTLSITSSDIRPLKSCRNYIALTADV